MDWKTIIYLEEFLHFCEILIWPGANIFAISIVIPNVETSCKNPLELSDRLAQVPSHDLHIFICV